MPEGVVVGAVKSQFVLLPELVEFGVATWVPPDASEYATFT